MPSATRCTGRCCMDGVRARAEAAVAPPMGRSARCRLRRGRCRDGGGTRAALRTRASLPAAAAEQLAIVAARALERGAAHEALGGRATRLRARRTGSSPPPLELELRVLEGGGADAPARRRRPAGGGRVRSRPGPARGGSSRPGRGRFRAPGGCTSREENLAEARVARRRRCKRLPPTAMPDCGWPRTPPRASCRC